MLDLAVRILAAVDAHLDKKHRLLPAAAIDEFHLGRYPHRRVHVAVQGLLKQLAAGYTTPFWVDKTPSRESVLSVPFLARTWPNAQFIFLKRRGLENMMSRLRKFPQTNFERHCLDWALIMSDWRTVRSSISERFIELEQRSMLADPSGTARQVAELLCLDEIEAEALRTELATVRTEVTDAAAHVVNDAAETGWSAEMIARFRAICGPEMEAYGYTFDGRYSE